VLATNIAETSLTIDGVRTVIDSGLARVAGFDPRRGMDRLELKRISLASATQRSGRAGRTAPGRCLRLWPKSQERAMAAFELPEVRRLDLCATVLTLHEWGKTDPRSFAWFEPPDEKMLTAAERLLAMLGAIDREESGSITPLGRRLLELPAHPRIGRLMVGAVEAGLLLHGATLAALIEEKDILRSPPSEPVGAGARPGSRSPTTSGPSDLLHRMQLFSEIEKRVFRAAAPGAEDVDAHAARQVARARDELMRIGRRLDLGRAGDPSNEEQALLRLVLLAYPDRVARRRGPAGSAVMVGGSGIRLAGESVVRQAEFFVAVDAREDECSASREALVRIASAIDVGWLEELFPASIRKVRELVFDPRRERVVGRGAVYYRDLLLREDLDAPVDPERAGPILAEALRPRAEEIVAADPAASIFLARVKLLRQAMPEYPWPAFNAQELADALAEACRRKRSVEEVRRGNLVQILQAALAYPLPRVLEQQAPEALPVPSGNRIRLDYAADGRVVLAARLQELFGWTDTPKIAAGRIAVVVHLLGPNYRPVQITEDLRSFWSTTYFQVRKDLRTRYPKHSWPEDPLTAKAEAKGRKRQG
jgi:ATP-dependent helicase HrpB